MRGFGVATPVGKPAQRRAQPSQRHAQLVQVFGRVGAGGDLGGIRQGLGQRLYLINISEPTGQY